MYIWTDCRSPTRFGHAGGAFPNDEAAAWRLMTAAPRTPQPTHHAGVKHHTTMLGFVALSKRPHTKKARFRRERLREESVSPEVLEYTEVLVEFTFVT